ncbi:MAG TPA: M48 family metallopeptidase, partial [Candidatus Eisenbacteria bacterium]|nr:M48 family metallopeptidase [Candidatus Eisenbacteria bacterium]
MDFFTRQDQARRKTKWLVVYFALAVIGIVATVYLLIALIFLKPDLESLGALGFFGRLWNPALFFGVAFATLSVIFAGSLFKMAELRQGGSAVAESLGGQPLDVNSRDLEEKKVLHVVEEMAIASGIPVPQIYLLPQEPGINAFAAGYSSSDAAIGVTSGCAKFLTRDELQGVIAHEFSHILNGDMRLNLRLIGLVNGILCLALIGRILLRTRGRRNPLPLVGLGLIVVGFSGVFFGRLIKSAVSRQREFLADAAAVQFTRNPEGLAGALKKIGGLARGSQLETPRAEEASHLFFGNALKSSWFNLMSTHPPLEERIRALDPNFDGVFPAVQFERPVAEAGTPAQAYQKKRVPVPRVPAVLGAGLLDDAQSRIRPADVLLQIGSPTSGHIDYAGQLKSELPETLVAAARQPVGACAIIYGLLLSADEPARGIQLQQLSAHCHPATFQETARLYPAINSLQLQVKLPLIDLALPALRRFSADQYDEFTTNLQLLIESDRRIQLFEYMIQKIVMRHLEPHYRPIKKPVIQYYALLPLENQVVVLLSALAYTGQDSQEKITAAFACGAAQLNLSAKEVCPLPYADCDLPQIDSALNRLSEAAPQIKKDILNACAHTVASDGVIETQEAELLRAIADTLDCP